MKENGRSKGVAVDSINGYMEHCHCLTALRATQTMSKVIQLMKGESARWINKKKLCNEKFEWQDDFYGVSVSEGDLDRVRRYINNQEEHHKKKSFAEEFELLKKKYFRGSDIN
jgi:REP element-mobilizing transposase RayT